jgi:RHS repeat-associated protein
MQISPSTTAFRVCAFAYMFTGKERDAESGLDYFGARYYASTMGRFMSPDWAAKAEPVPYAKLGDPQTLNLYGYVKNNPLSRIDPDGHDDITYDQHGKEIDRQNKHGFWWHTVHNDNYSINVRNQNYKLVGQGGPLRDLGKGSYNVMDAKSTANLMNTMVNQHGAANTGEHPDIGTITDQSRSHGGWDFKSTAFNSADLYIIGGNAYHADYVGNMIWGGIMASYGVPESTPHAGAGAQQVVHDIGSGHWPSGTIGSGGDQPLDYEAIHRGYEQWPTPQ